MKQQSGVPAEVKFKVERAFYFKGEVLEKGKVYTLPRHFAIEMQHAHKGKVEMAEPAAAVVSNQSQQTPSVPERVTRSGEKKETGNAR